MTNLEKEALENIMFSYQASINDKKLLKGRWDKIWDKYLPETFGIEIEIPLSTVNVKQTRNNLMNLSEKNYNTLKRRLVSAKLNKSADNKFHNIQLGTDLGSYEFRMFCSKHSLKYLDEAIKELNKCFPDIDYSSTVLNLHIHIPTSLNEPARRRFGYDRVLKKLINSKEIYKFINADVSRFVYDLTIAWRPEKYNGTGIGEDYLMYSLNSVKNTLHVEGVNRHIGFMMGDLPIKYSGIFNTVEVRGMNTDLSYEGLMTRVVASSIIKSHICFNKPFNKEVLQFVSSKL